MNIWMCDFYGISLIARSPSKCGYKLLMFLADVYIRITYSDPECQEVIFCYIVNELCCVDMASADAVLTIHSSKAHITSTLTLSTTSLADAIIQLAIAKGERHEVSLLFLLVNSCTSCD